MVASRVIVAAALGGVLSLGIGSSQELPRELPSEPVSNWTAPPFWSPPRAVEFEKPKEPRALEPSAVEGVPTIPLPFVGIPPCRIVDTRPSSGFTGAYGPPAMIANASRDFDLNSAPHCPGIPANAEAYSINVTVTETTGLGDVRIWPTGSPPAVPVSTQNWPTAGLSVANAAIVPAGTDGSITVFVAGSSTHLIIDINGYYAPISIVNTVNNLSGAITLAAGSNISITPAGNTLTIASSGGGASGWSLTGNSGTNPASNFVGTTDNQALELKVNGQRALRLEPNPIPNVIGGASGNSVTSGVSGATIGGGAQNRVTDHFGTVGGGVYNQAGNGGGPLDDADAATVCGGTQNTAGAFHAFVGGGGMNTAGGPISTVGGGNLNIADGPGANIPGGQANTASGAYSMILGGFNNTAAGQFSLAAGTRARAMNPGSFVWGGDVDADVSSTGPNQFIVRAPGGVWLGTTSNPEIDSLDFLSTSTGAHLTLAGVWKNNSDRAAKEDFEPVDERNVLERLAALPILRWKYKVEGSGVRHLGPMAQDFAVAFGLGGDDRSISTLDAEGVALAAIQALYEEVQELRKRLAELEKEKN